MKLIQQVSLESRSANSNQVFEVALYRVGDEQFNVNFRYGKQGEVLSEGTKTTSAVSETRARKIFDELVASKLEQGFFDVNDPSSSLLPSDSGTASHIGEPSPNEPLSEQQARVLARLLEGHQSLNNWPLSRAVWKAGQLRLADAESTLIALSGTGDAMLDYCIAWALGQCGTDNSLDLLRRLESEHENDSVRRICGVALLQLLEGEQRELAVAEICQHLPHQIQNLVATESPDSMQEAVIQHFTDRSEDDIGLLELLYLMNTPSVRPAVLKCLRTLPFKVGSFHRIRYIFKAAEMRRDWETYSVIARRLETTPANFTMYHARYYPKKKLPTTQPNPTQSFSNQTRNYLRRRVWRIAKQMGELQQASDYVTLASEYLLTFSDEDAQPTRRRSFYRYDFQSRTSTTRDLNFDRYSRYFTFNKILYTNSPRYESYGDGLEFFCISPFAPGDGEPKAREEAFPEIWDQHPNVVLKLLLSSQCEPVHHFGAKVLRANQPYCKQLTLETLLDLLGVRYEATLRLAFDFAVARFDPTNPNPDLVFALANCHDLAARQKSFEWVRDHRDQLFNQTDFVIKIVAAKQADTRQFARDTLRKCVFSESTNQVIIAGLIARLTQMSTDESEVAADVVQSLLLVFGPGLRNIGEDVIRDMLHHELPEVQRFAGDLVLNHETYSKHPPDDVLSALLASNHEAVRGIGVQIIGNLPDDILLQSIDLLFGLSRHELSDVRAMIRPSVRRLASEHSDFAAEISGRLVNALLIPGAADGVPSHTATLLKEDLSNHMQAIPAETVWALIQSRSTPAQEIGGLLLSTNVNFSQIDFGDIVILGNHEIHSIRESCREVVSKNVTRAKQDVESAARLLDSAWDDTRTFAFQYFREHLLDADLLSPDLLISICDSVRPDTQQFGRELITKSFQLGQGEDYVVKLSEHPAESMQLFASGFLDQNVKDNPDRLRRLAPFFLSVLCKVNRGRVAKSRSLLILAREAAKSEEAATVVAEILTQVSATIAITDRAAAVETLLQIQQQYPSLTTPLSVKPLEVRGAV